MHEFQAENIDAFRSDRVVCVVNTGTLRVKVFQIFFGKDGSLFISFPCLKHRTGILSSTAIPAGTVTSDVNLQTGGKVTSHLVKYSHHPDGRAHFSQDGKIFTAIKRQSIALDTQHGHLFSLQVQGLGALDIADPVKDVNKQPKKSVIDFIVEPSDTIKFVGRWFNVDRMRFAEPTPTVGPILPTCDPGGVTRVGCMVASPYANARHVLFLTCEVIPSLGPEPEIFSFCGGFDSAEVMTDPRREAGFLAFYYPIADAEQLKERIGTVDYAPSGG